MDDGKWMREGNLGNNRVQQKYFSENVCLWLRRKYFHSEKKRKISFSFAFLSLNRTFASNYEKNRRRILHRKQTNPQRSARNGRSLKR